MKKYRVTEIFKSIQGEGYHAGRNAVFVRFSGCNLKCKWCDTKHKVKDTLYLDTIVDRVLEKSEGSKLLVLTGGEPLLQVDTDLFWRFLKMGFEVAIETNGTIKFPLKNLIWLTVSPKVNTNWVQMYGKELKIINDGWWSKEAIAKLSSLPFDHFFIQPCERKRHFNYKETAKLVQELGEPWRLSCQIHKIVGMR